MKTEERRTIDEFKVAVSLLRTGPDGFPLPGQGLELEVTSQKVVEVADVCEPADDDEKRSLMELAVATMQLIAAVDSRMPDYSTDDPTIPQRWFRARADLVEPSEAGQK
jgi:hypothetical protein